MTARFGAAASHCHEVQNSPRMISPNASRTCTAWLTVQRWRCYKWSYPNSVSYWHLWFWVDGNVLQDIRKPKPRYVVCSFSRETHSFVIRNIPRMLKCLNLHTERRGKKSAVGPRWLLFHTPAHDNYIIHYVWCKSIQATGCLSQFALTWSDTVWCFAVCAHIRKTKLCSYMKSNYQQTNWLEI